MEWNIQSLCRTFTLQCSWNNSFKALRFDYLPLESMSFPNPNILQGEEHVQYMYRYITPHIFCDICILPFSVHLLCSLVHNLPFYICVWLYNPVLNSCIFCVNFKSLSVHNSTVIVCFVLLHHFLIVNDYFSVWILNLRKTILEPYSLTCSFKFKPDQKNWIKFLLKIQCKDSINYSL